MTSLSVAGKLNALPGTRWLLNRHPVVAFLCSLGLSPLFMWLNDVLFVWGRILPLSYQWLSALFDGLLAVGIGVMIGSVRKIPFHEFPRVIQWLVVRRSFHVVLILVWLVLSLLHMYLESDSVNTWDQRSGLNYLYHNFVLFPFLGYLYTLLLAAVTGTVLGMRVGSDGWRGRVFIRLWLSSAVAMAIGLAWVWAGSSFDASHQRAPNGISKHRYSNPPRPWCGGVITVHICGPVKGRAPIN